eukprot:TRINITY_DN6213_c0_g3_i4.p1 TRINITY_DN6213_c0_g3~~TRINITY_DN6213_c0_g3_i4.p1  ORF type:complete len:1264 (+),score=174.47 TRINITY_DN6213_c0_g3_i4:76-3792(+)
MATWDSWHPYVHVLGFVAMLVTGVRLDDLKRLHELATRGAPDCQYSSFRQIKNFPSGVPPDESLIGICPHAYFDKCQPKHSKYFSVEKAEEEKGNVGAADCLQICNTRSDCIGYVVSKEYTQDDVEKGSLQCALIHKDAKMSSTMPDEVKLSGWSKTLNKLTFFKDYCGCKARLVQFEYTAEELSDTKQLAVDEAKLSMQETAKESLLAQVQELRQKQESREFFRKFDGIYVWLPERPPHRIRKAKRYMATPHMLIPSRFGGVQTHGYGFHKYVEAPIRITHVFVKQNLSAVLYRCLNKTEKNGQDVWHFAKQSDLVDFVDTTLNRNKDASKEFSDMMNSIQGSEDDMKALWAHSRCIGTPIERLPSGKGAIHYKIGDEDHTAFLNPSFFSADPTKDGASLSPHAEVAQDGASLNRNDGCYASENDAESAAEESIVQRFPECPTADFQESLLSRVYNGTLSMATLAFEAAKTTSAYGLIMKPLSKILGGTNEDLQSALQNRFPSLLKAFDQMQHLFKTSSVIKESRVKLSCANSFLKTIFEVGGLMAKISQTLAMRPDIVPDDLVRAKLKETQNANTMRDPKETVDYIEEQEPVVTLPDNSTVKLLDLVEHTKGLSAGSVGQVDLFKIRNNDAGPDIQKAREQFREMMVQQSGGPLDNDAIVVKTVFAKKEQEYKEDWALLTYFFETFYTKIPKKMQVVWDMLKPMEKSIFEEFDLGKEAEFTAEGKKALETFTEEQISSGNYKDLMPRDLKLTTPAAVATTSKYVLIQSIARGLPLKNYLEQNAGQIERLIEWKQSIYSAILMVYGHMVVGNGFFQSDPHNGNWFWDASSKTVTLIDWGGVERLKDETRCKLARMYHQMGALQEKWKNTEAVQVEVEGKAQQLKGTYYPNGVSIFKAGEEDKVYMFGLTFEASYFEPKEKKRLRYDGQKWSISQEHLGKQELYESLATFQNNRSLPTNGKSTWVFRGKNANLKLTRTNAIGLKSRRQAYADAAFDLGVRLQFNCDGDLTIAPEGPLTAAEFDKWEIGNKAQLTCIRKDAEGKYIIWGYKNTRRLAVTEDEEGNRYVDYPNNPRFNLNRFKGDHLVHSSPKLPENEALSLDRFHPEAKARFEKLTDPKMKDFVLRVGRASMAAAAALFDSDVATFASFGLDAKDAKAIFQTEVLEEYTLLGRCIVVFHGMLGDLVQEGLKRLVPMDYLAWLMNSNAARFFDSWAVPAKRGLLEVCPKANLTDGPLIAL